MTTSMISTISCQRSVCCVFFSASVNLCATETLAPSGTTRALALELFLQLDDRTLVDRQEQAEQLVGIDFDRPRDVRTRTFGRDADRREVRLQVVHRRGDDGVRNRAVGVVEGAELFLDLDAHHA